jgi:hypothetical protein
MFNIRSNIIFGVIALSVPLAASVDIRNCGGGPSTMTASCYTCPDLQSFSNGFLSWEYTAYVCFGHMPDSSDTRVSCRSAICSSVFLFLSFDHLTTNRYHAEGYTEKISWWEGSKEVYHPSSERFIGRCYYSVRT